MKWPLNAVIACCLLCNAVARADDSPDSTARIQELTRQIDATEQQIKQAQAKRDALVEELEQARQNAVTDLLTRAQGGDESALRQVLARIAEQASIVDYDWAKPFKGQAAGHAKRIGLIREAMKSANASQRVKFCWMLGQNGSDDAAAALRDVLGSEKEGDVIGSAIAAMSRCPDSPANLDAVKPHQNDDRLLKQQIGYYARGSLNHEPVGLLAREYVKQRDAANARTVPGEVTVEIASLFCAGFQWRIGGDANYNCIVRVRYRKVGTPAWTTGMPLLRCRSWESGNPRYTFDVGNLLAGSIFNLEPGTTYDVELSLADPDGGEAIRTVQVTTRTEPPAHAGTRTLYVAPLDLNKPGATGQGTKADPYRGIAAADKAAQPGDLLLLMPGRYAGSVQLTQHGEPGKPIVWRGMDRDQVILDGTGKDESLGFSGLDHLQFEDLTFVGANQGCIKTFGCQDIVVRRCVFREFKLGGIIAQGRPHRERRGEIVPGRNCARWFVIDNDIHGPKDWRKDRGNRESYGVNLSGEGHVIAWNRIDDCWDCISLAGSNNTLPNSGSLDICHNDLRQGSDDGIEADYVFHNVRVYRNRLTNTFSSLSFQPVYGGPGYLLYNAMHNTGNKPFKLHVHASGMIIAHNTCTSAREAFNGGNCHDAWLVNNLLLGQRGTSGYWMEALADPLRMDHNGYTVSGAGPQIKLNNVRYRSIADFTEATGQMDNSVRLDWNVLANSTLPAGYHVIDQPRSLELRPGSPAVDAGKLLPGINNGFAGAAPDLGCYELGKPTPHYGPRK